ncbi:hypothetical protein I8748_24725 [Nostoc sp. CENA67]|uniref:Uncharacterized protein n=1 Tax=Amazonocrinis nigriterrae CENA67 TaxID=2794033 RepID=A0A8J7HTD4_9NOST|nr:hypothetical protein [Amazonocrinis nigriterrae]MBH8565347.1 hypothetical protein [Amazonocrinis nigriterrae CENA67]
MAAAEDILTQKILDLLLKQPEGLEVEEISNYLQAEDSDISPRGVRNILNKLVKEEKLKKNKKIQNEGRGKPPYIYFHPSKFPYDSVLGAIPEIKDYTIQTKSDVEEDDLEPDERQSQEQGRSVLERIAASHLQEEAYARAVIDTAYNLAQENPIDLLIKMTQWVVNDINQKGEEIQQLLDREVFEEAKRKADQLDYQIGWSRRYFQLFWRLDSSKAGIKGTLDLPLRFTQFKRGKRAFLDEPEARKILHKRIFGDKIIECWSKKTKPDKGVAGTDASVADIFLTQNPGSFIPRQPIIVTTSASALISKTDQEYQDFDISPDYLREYDDYQAARNGLVLAPALMNSIGTDRFKHSRMAAMELRQYVADFRIATGEARWRPLGDAPELGYKPNPSLIIRDGRVFPLVHRLGDYEDDTLYGQIVRNQIQKFVSVIHNTIFSPFGEIVYSGAVKIPQMSWLAPLVFWYLYNKKVQVNRKIVVTSEDVYKSPFADTAVSHLLFLGVAKHLQNFSPDILFTTCRVLRRFSDIALVETSLPVIIESEMGQPRLLQENNREDWQEFIEQHLENKQKQYQEPVLDETDYEPFLYLCTRIGAFMCYAAPTSAYQPIVTDDGGAGHFLIPRLEVAVDLHHQDSYERNLDKMLSWLAKGNWELDYAHTQSGFNSGDEQNSLPILVPSVTLIAHEAATFSSSKFREEVQDEIRDLIAELKRRVTKGSW